MLDLVISDRRRSLGGFAVGRVLPYAKRRMVGPFIFFDHMGPIDLPAGIPSNVDVLPIPISGSPPLPICLTARSCIATASDRSSPSGRAK